MNNPELIPGQVNVDGKHRSRLEVGSTVIVDRRPWLLLEISEYPDRQWPSSYRRAWHDHVELWNRSASLYDSSGRSAKIPPRKADFYKRPVVVVLRDENFPRSTPKQWCVPASRDWQILPEHYAVCRACGELPPCSNAEYRSTGGSGWVLGEDSKDFIVPPNCCMGCSELIKPRVRTVSFPGPNLWYPDLEEGSAIFHGRSACAEQVDRYRMQWRAENIRSLEPSASTPLFFDLGSGPLPRNRVSSDRVNPVPEVTAASMGEQQEPSPAPPSSGIHSLGLSPLSSHRPSPEAPSDPAPAADGADDFSALRQAAKGFAPDRPAFYDAEQAARVIEELTSAVRTIALCLNNTNNQNRP